jgi:peptide/nickel transport system permease protein
MLARYILKRLLIAIPTLLLISLAVFTIIQLPPGSYLDARLEAMQKEGAVDKAELQALEDQYHISQPLLVQYVYWLGGFLTGDLGRSFETGVPVSETLRDQLPSTIAVSIFAIALTWVLAVPLGIIAAVKRNTPWDYGLTLLSLTVMATPGFILALVFQLLMQWMWPGFDPTGLVSRSQADAPMSMAKLLDIGAHLIVPAVILGVGGTAGMIRILRANMIDELKKQYVLCARARGLHPAMVILRYPLRVAINPFIANVGNILPHIISGSVVISVVLGLPTLGPTLLTAIMSQDTYLATSIIFIQCILCVIGVLLSDILLAAVDPRIKFDAK